MRFLGGKWVKKSKSKNKGGYSVALRFRLRQSGGAFGAAHFGAAEAASFRCGGLVLRRRNDYGFAWGW
jgi:hypothetical protein